MNNVWYVKFMVLDEDVFEVCCVVCIYDQIMGFLYGYGISVGERGMNLLGGQLQCFVIVWVILKRFDIVLLDEVISFVDIEIEYSIYQFFKVFCKDCIMFVVVYCLFIIMNVYIIVVFY